MVRAGMYVAAGALAVVAAWAGGALLAPAEAAPPSVPVAADAKGVDLTALRDAVDAAARKGENVDEVRKALDAFEKAGPKAGGVTAELQALRDAVDSAAKKGENVEAIAKELITVETAVAGRALTKPKPAPQPDPNPNLDPNRFPRPVPIFPNPILPNPGVFPNPGIGGVGGGVDVQMFNKAMELRKKAIELLLKDPNDPNALIEAQKLQTEAAELMLKAARGLAGGGAAGIGGLPVMPGFPDVGRVPAMPAFPDMARVPDRARLGIRLDRVPPVAVEQLGLEANTGIVVTLVVAGSSAEKAGLKVHDIILEFAGKAVTDNTEEFIRRVNEVKAGEKIDLVLLRKGKKVDVKGVELPGAQPFRAPPMPVRPNVANPFQKVADALGAPPVPAPVNPPVNPIPNPAPPPQFQPVPVNPIPNPIPIPPVGPAPVNPIPNPVPPPPRAPVPIAAPPIPLPPAPVVPNPVPLLP